MPAKTTSPQQPMDQPNQPANPQEPGGQVARPFGRVSLGLPELTAQFEPLTVTVGDLFASQEYLLYLPLASTRYTGSLAGIGSLVAGIAGGLAASVSNLQNIKNARDHAKASRQADYGVPLEERAQKYKGLVIPRASIDSIEIINNGQGLRITHSGAQLDLGSDNAAECSRQLHAWLAGTLEGDLDTQGANLNLPPASTLLTWFIDGSLAGKFSQPGLDEIASEQNYIEGLFMEFDLKNYPAKTAVINTVRRLPGKWPAVFLEHLQALKAKGRCRLGWAAAAGGLGLLGIGYSFLPSVAGQAAGVLAIGIFSLMLSIPVMLLNSFYNNKLNKLISLLGTP
jgi:hypothetical protein